eukprot:gnl/MRDRNA2_/MRDRNA2_134304_c0_seq1.p1 gnl/MRDRNA2_/MRDRNA2_134304_c0~~gnl/MRDRNA2_/MRDRNA2_134304_c0_seq1.p1  ORF type:complete len:339 (-),score=28.27 gnl/MRDRNA2_/MRDRNA2_134304_c0_seq1:44-1060(-)
MSPLALCSIFWLGSIAIVVSASRLKGSRRSGHLALPRNLSKLMDDLRRDGATPVRHPMEPYWQYTSNATIGLVNNSQLQAKSLGYLREYLTELHSLTYNCQRPIRLGSPNDGGYVACADVPFETGHGCTMLSYGIANDDNFEIQVAQKGCQVHEFDPTVTGSPGARQLPDRIHFHQEGVWNAPGTLNIGRVDTVPNHMNAFWQKSTGLSLKMDVEGAEWVSLPSISDNDLKQVRLLNIELHLLAPDHELLQMMPSCIAQLQRLKKHFYLYHVHFNNCDGCVRPYPGSGYNLPAAVELSMVRKDIIADEPQGPFHPRTEMDKPNIPSRPPADHSTFPIP